MADPKPADSLSMDAWPFVAVAAIGKQIGILQERLPADSPEAAEVNAVETELNEVLFSTAAPQNSILTSLAIRLDAISQA